MNISEISATNETWNFYWRTFANVSLTYDLVSCQNATKGTSEDATLAFENPAKLGILTGLLITCLADFRIATPKLDDNLDSQLKAMAMTLLNLTIFSLLAPIIASTLAVLFAYRKIVQLILTLTLKEEFAGLLAGSDCVWSLEDSAALSVINVLGNFEKNPLTTNESFLMNFRRVMEKCLSLSSLEKLNWTREKKYGYCYWRSGGKIRVEEHVRWMEDEEGDEKCNDFCQAAESHCLNDILKKLTNRPLPMEHSTSWEILIGRNCTRSSRNSCEMENLRDETTIPVLFRIHHCVGDGVALLRLLLESIADSRGESIANATSLNKEGKRISVPRLRKSFSITGVVETEKEILYNDKRLFDATMPFATRIPVRTVTKSILSYLDDRSKILESEIAKLRALIERTVLEHSWDTLGQKILDRTKNRMGRILKTFWVIVSAPNCLIQQALRSMDNSALHGPPLSGEKLLSRWMEGDFECSKNSNLLAKIRDIKNATGSRFGDVILAALAENLHRHYSKIGEAAPKAMTVVIPARMTAPSKKFNLQNDFSVGLLTLCCSEVDGELPDTNENTRLYERIKDVARSSEKLRNDPDYLINFYVMNWLSALLPECFLKPVLESGSTLVFSNLPGPQEISIIDHTLRNIAFWIPHRGKTGLGCSLLTYGGKIHLSISADTALINSQNLLDEIVRNTIDDIDKFYDSISFACATFRV